jgi:serine/threonine-protein kinase
MGVSAPAVGTVLGGTYRLERELGRGGMGSVYEASHVRLPRRYAVKLLKGEFVHDRDVFDRFRREAEIASSLGHDNIVEVFDFNFSDDGQPYMVLELLTGEDLSARLGRGGPLNLQQMLQVLRQVASALEAAHARGIVHRDLKPSNLFLCKRPGKEELVKVLDFGISKVLHTPSMATQTGAILGTPNYMSPEQALGKQSEIDGRTDVFALGAIIYECLTGQRAFDGPSAVGILFKVNYDTPEPMGSFVDLPAGVDTVVRRALMKDRNHRYPTAQALLEDFERACSGAPLDATLAHANTSAPSKPAPATIDAPSPVAATVATPAPAITTLRSVASEIAPRPATPRRRLPIALGGAALLLALGIAVVAPRLRETRKPAAQPPPPPVIVETRAPATPTVGLSLVISPEEAQVELDGVEIPSRALRVPQGSEHTIVVRADGYNSQTRTIRPQTDGRISIKLEPLPAPASKPHPSVRPKKKPAPNGIGPVEKDI